MRRLKNLINKIKTEIIIIKSLIDKKKNRVRNLNEVFKEIEDNNKK